MIDPATLAVGDRVEFYHMQTIVHEVNQEAMFVTLRLGTIEDKPILRVLNFEECARSHLVHPGRPVTSEDEVRARRQAEGLSAG